MLCDHTKPVIPRHPSDILARAKNNTRTYHPVGRRAHRPQTSDSKPTDVRLQSHRRECWTGS
eukprot:COSAG06_NODE_22729_length_714_cov_1.918699_1_plen_61_part_10